MLTRTNLQADLPAIRSLVAELEPLFKNNRLYVTARPGAADPLHDGTGWLPEGESEADFTEITPPFRGTAVEALLKSLPVPIRTHASDADVAEELPDVPSRRLDAPAPGLEP